MSFVRRLDMKKLSPLIVAVVLVLASGTIAFLLIGDTSAPVSATPLSYQAADMQVPSDPAQAEQAPADRTPREPAAPHQNPDDPTAGKISASEMPPPDPSASEQSRFKSRRALETVDPRELLRQGKLPN